MCCEYILLGTIVFFELDKGVTCLCVQQQLVTRAYYIISRIYHQSVSASGSFSKFIVESGNCFVTSYHTIFCSHVCVLCLCLNITKLVLDSAIVNCISQSKQLMGTPHKVTNYLPMLPLFVLRCLIYMRRLQDGCLPKFLGLGHSKILEVFI